MFIPEIETKSTSEIKQYQESRLPKTMQYLSDYSRYYQNLFQENKIDISKIKHLEDLQHIPVTTKDNLQKNSKDFLCVGRNKIVDYVTTSGTMGEPVTFAMTNNDLDRLAYNEYISFSCADSTSNDIFQLMVTLDKRFMAGMAYFLGLRQMGAGIIRTGPGLQKLQLESIINFEPTGLITVPSFIPKLINYAKKHNIDFQNSSVKKAVCIGEPIRNTDFSLNTLGQRIKNNWDIKLYSTYASTEMGTAFTECSAGKGGHHHPEMIIVEFLDENNNPVKEGEPGEVTITTLGVEAMPLLRFKTGDICHHYNEPCECGRNTIRLGPVIGRKQQMIKLKGTTLYPPAVYDVLNQIDYIDNYIVEAVTSELGTDELIVNVGCEKIDKNTEKRIKDNFRAKLRVAPKINFLSPEEISTLQFKDGKRKPVIFIDQR